ncbi:MAG: DMT family transporter [Sulfitobacter sp.]
MGQGQVAGVCAVLFAAVVWGTTGTAATFAPGVSAAAIGAAAMGLGGIAQALWAGRGIVRARGALWQGRGMLALGALSVAVYPLAFYGAMRLAGVTLGTVITIGAAPLFSALIEYAVDGTRASRRWAFGAAIGVFGMGVMCLAGTGGHGGGDGNAELAGHSVALGAALGLLGALSYALYSWSARRMMLGGMASRVAMGATFGLGGVVLLPVLVATGAPFLESWQNAVVGIYMAAVPMFLGYLAFGYGLARINASMATTLTLIEPVVAAGLAALVVGERLGPAGWGGAAVVVAGLLVITLPARRTAR